MIRTCAIAACSWTLALAATNAQAQWLNFSDETATRLQIQPFLDAPAGNPLTDAEEKDIAVADLDHDGREDVVVVRKRPFSNAGVRQDLLLINEGGVLVDRTETFAPGFRVDFTDARDVFVADFTGDGWEDVVIANTFGQQPRFYRNAGEDAGGNWLGLINESSLRLPFLFVPADLSTLQFCAVWGGDLTGNGALDLYFSNYDPTAPTQDVLLINDGSGHFTNESVARLGSYQPVSFGSGVEIHDVDADGDQDIVKMSTLYPAPPFPVGQFILFNDGNGLFDTVPYQTLPTDNPYMFAVGDLNGDALPDMYLEGDSQDRVIIAQSAVPDSNVQYAVNVLSGSTRTASFGGNVKLADVDGDGDVDAGVAPIDVDIQNCGFAEDFALLRNDGSGSLQDPWAASNDQNFHVDPHDFGFLDIDGDGCLDMLMGLCQGWRVFMQQNCALALAAPLRNFLVRFGTALGGSVAELAVSDDQRASMDSVLNGAQTLHVTSSFAGAQSPQTKITSLTIAVEARASEPEVSMQAQLRDFSANAWVTVDFYTLPANDARHEIAVADAARFLRFDGLLLLRLQTQRESGIRDGTYRVDYDLVQARVTP